MKWKLIIFAGVLAASVTSFAVGRIDRSNGSGVAATLFPSSQASALRVVIDGVRSDSGTVMVGLYDSTDGFVAAIKHSTEAGLLNDKGRRVGMALRAATGVQSIVFTELPPRRYAVIVFHDENDNGRLDENGWGVPMEGYGFSNDAQGFLGAPSFDAAAVTLEGRDRSIAISLIYPKVLARSELPDRADKSVYDPPAASRRNGNSE
jgi:uncharacterized protein (DUF2141 family)